MFKKENKKGECPKTPENKHKKGKCLKKKNREKGRTYKYVKMSNKKVKSFWKCRCVQKEVIDRENKKRKKRQKMNKSINKRRTLRDVTHACKKWKVEESFDTKGKGNCCSKKKTEESEGKDQWVQEEGDQEKKRSNKTGNEKRGECETWWTKTRSAEKRIEEKFVKKKKKKAQKIARDSVFFNTEEFLKKKRKDKKETKLTLQKNQEKRKIPQWRKLYDFVRL